MKIVIGITLIFAFTYIFMFMLLYFDEYAIKEDIENENKNLSLF